MSRKFELLIALAAVVGFLGSLGVVVYGYCQPPVDHWQVRLQEKHIACLANADRMPDCSSVEQDWHVLMLAQAIKQVKR